MTYDPIVRPELWKANPDFFARRTHFVDHLAPIWKALDNSEKGKFYVPDVLLEYTRSQGIEDCVGIRSLSSRNNLVVRPPGKSPIVTCAYGDMEQAYHSYNTRPLILMEHGVGLSFNHPGYGGGEGLRRRVSLFLAPNKNIYDKTHRTFPNAPQVIVGTPKMDTTICKRPEKKEKPVIAISFHWNGKAVCPEAGNALNHYLPILPFLAAKYTIVGHGHPKIMERLIPMYKEWGITDIEPDFDKVLERCDIYINDASSTLYEFSCTGKPVIILNAPWFRRYVKYGIRFWDYTNIGIQVNEPEDLFTAIDKTIANPAKYYSQRCKMVEELYPYLGHSAERAAQAITKYIRSKRNGTTFIFEQT